MAVTYTAGRKPTEGGIWIAIVGNKATFFIERGGIKITPYLGWSWVEWGGVGLARAHFWHNPLKLFAFVPLPDTYLNTHESIRGQGEARKMPLRNVSFSGLGH